MKFVASLLVTLVLAGCASTSYLNQAKPTRGDLRGMVYDLDRLPVADAVVRLDGAAASTKTDVHGHCLLADVAFGPVVLVFEKPGYESFRWSGSYSEVSQVVYAQMADGPQLYDAAAEALDKKEWALAQTTLDRARALDADGPRGALLSALLAGRMGKPEEAVALLEAYLTRFPRFLTLELAAADYSQYSLNQPERALKHLQAAQALRYDPEVDLRIRTLQGTVTH